MPTTSRRESADAEPIAPVVPLHRPKFVVAEGRGGSGKTTVIRVLVERAQNAGRAVAVVDLDPRAQLREFFEAVSAPAHHDEVVVHDFLDALVNAQVEADPPPSFLVDMNGNDPVFGRFAGSVDLVPLLEDAGVMPVRVRVLGADGEDLADLARDDAAGAFVPAQTVLVLNAGAIKARYSAESAFSAFVGVREHPVFRAAVARGARVVELPRLDCMAAVNDRRLQFVAAADDMALGRTNMSRLKKWWPAVESALAPVSAWLP